MTAGKHPSRKLRLLISAVICIVGALALASIGLAGTNMESCTSLLEKKQYQDALSRCKRESAHGSRAAQYAVGVIYDSGLGVQVDEKEAFRNYHESARNGYRPAQLVVGHMFRNGRGTATDLHKAVFWYKKYVKQGGIDSAYGYFLLGEICSNEMSFECTPTEAYKWYFLASIQGYSAADRKKRDLGRTMNPRDIDEAILRASSWLSKHGI